MSRHYLCEHCRETFDLTGSPEGSRRLCSAMTWGGEFDSLFHKLKPEIRNLLIGPGPYLADWLVKHLRTPHEVHFVDADGRIYDYEGHPICGECRDSLSSVRYFSKAPCLPKHVEYLSNLKED